LSQRIRECFHVALDFPLDCAQMYTYIHVHMRRNVTLSIDEELYREMKLQAVREDRDVSTITEELYEEYLKRTKAKSKK
jgi:hypothetical protein